MNSVEYLLLVHVLYSNIYIPKGLILPFSETYGPTRGISRYLPWPLPNQLELQSGNDQYITASE